MLVGRSAVMQELRVRVARVATTDFTVLIEGRERRRQGAGGARRSTSSVAARAGRSSRSTARRSSRRCSRRSCSASRSARRPACAGGAASSSRPTTARCFSTRSRICRRRRRPSCCACCRTCPVERVGGQHARQVDMRIMAATNRSLARAGRRPDASGRISTTACAASSCTCRRCARAASDIPLLVELLPGAASTHASAADLDPRPSKRWSRTTGRATCGSSERVIERAVALAPGPAIEIGDLPPEISQGLSATSSGEPVDHDERCARGAAATRGWCSSAATATSGARATCSTSATTRCRRTWITTSAAGRRSRTGARRGARRARAADGRLLTRGRTQHARGRRRPVCRTRDGGQTNMRITPLHFAIAAATAALLSASPAIAATPAPKGIVQRVKDPGTGLEVRVQQERPGQFRSRSETARSRCAASSARIDWRRR